MSSLAHASSVLSCGAAAFLVAFPLIEPPLPRGEMELPRDLSLVWCVVFDVSLDEVFFEKTYRKTHKENDFLSDKYCNDFVRYGYSLYA